MSFVAFALSKTLVKAGTRECGQDGDCRDYDEQLDQGEGAHNKGRGTFAHGFYGLEPTILRLAGERKRK